MPKIGMQPIRTSTLIDAVIAEIGATGSMDVTVSQIAKRAGMSSALAHHYFGSKNNMFTAAMRHILTRYGQEVRTNLNGKTDPVERLEAIIFSSFSEMNFNPEVIAAWLNFYVYAQKSSSVSKLLRVYHRRLRTALLVELRQVIPESAENVAEGIASIIDGAYLRSALRPEQDRPADPAALALQYLHLCLNEKDHL